MTTLYWVPLDLSGDHWALMISTEGEPIVVPLFPGSELEDDPEDP